MPCRFRSSPPAVALSMAVGLLMVGCSSGTADTTAQRPTSTTSPTSTTTTTSSPAEATCSTADVTVPYRQIPGIAADLTSVDVYPVAGDCSAPVIIWVHGGGYRVGDKRNQMRDKVQLFRDNGWLLVSVNYRLTAPGQPGSARFPDHFDDVAAAVAWVHGSIAPYGGDPARIALLGHSAGADIVANVATNPRYLGEHGLELSDVRCAGPLDTEGFDKATSAADEPGGETAQWREALGNNPNYVSETSATLLVRPGIGLPAMIGVVRGTPRRQQIEAAFLDAVRVAGADATTIDARSLTHAQVNSAIGAPGDVVMTPPLVAFLADCFS